MYKKQTKKQTHFDENCLTGQEFREWVAIVKGGNTKYRCKVCRKTNELSNRVE